MRFRISLTLQSWEGTVEVPSFADPFWNQCSIVLKQRGINLFSPEWKVYIGALISHFKLLMTCNS